VLCAAAVSLAVLFLLSHFEVLMDGNKGRHCGCVDCFVVVHVGSSGVSACLNCCAGTGLVAAVTVHGCLACWHLATVCVASFSLINAS